MKKTDRATKMSIAMALWVSSWPAMGADPLVIQELWEGRLYAKAFGMLQPALNDSNAEASDVTMLGIAYEEGLGTAANANTATSLYRRAASAGSAEAAYRLGRMYERGEGVAANAEAAFTWYEKAADRHAGAAYKYASAVLANESISAGTQGLDTIERLTFAAEQGNEDAALLLGSMYQDGLHLEKNAEKAARWLEQAADGSAEANRRLGMLLSHSDKAQAISYFKKAFDGGDTVAAAYLGYYADQAARNDEQRRIALEYYQKGKAADIAWANAGLARLEEQFRSIELLGMRMYGAKKHDVRFQLDKIGLPLLAESPGFWDAYDSKVVLPGSRSLTIAYAPGQDQIVAEIAYRFDQDGMRKEKLNFAKLREALSAKYGQYRNHKSGKTMAAAWAVGKTTILLKRLNDKKGLLLVYRFEPYSSELAEVYAMARKKAIESGDVMPEAL